MQDNNFGGIACVSISHPPADMAAAYTGIVRIDAAFTDGDGEPYDSFEGVYTFPFRAGREVNDLAAVAMMLSSAAEAEFSAFAGWGHDRSGDSPMAAAAGLNSILYYTASGMTHGQYLDAFRVCGKAGKAIFDQILAMKIAHGQQLTAAGVADAELDPNIATAPETPAAAPAESVVPAPDANQAAGS